MLFSGKENVFMCLVAFQKIFRKIFSDVWKRRRKRQTQEKYHQRSRSEIAISLARSRDQRRELATARSRDRRVARSRRRSRDHDLREIAPSIAIFTAIIGLELARLAPPGARSPPAIVVLTGMFLLLSRARVLSLSLSFSGNALKWKWGEKIISGSKVKILVNRKSFSVTAKHAGLGENDFRKWFSPKTNTA